MFQTFTEKSSVKMYDIREDDWFYIKAKKVLNDKRTLLYYDRLHVIYQSLKNIHHHFNSDKESLNFVEVGVYKGGGSYFIASIMKELSDNINFYCVDTFEGHSKKDLSNTSNDIHLPSWFSDTTYESVQSYLDDFDFIKLLGDGYRIVKMCLMEKQFTLPI